MAIRVLFFASLREALGVSTIDCELSPSTTSVGALRESLAARGGDWLALAPGRAVRAAVNQDMVDARHPLEDGDEVAFFPPVTGG